MEKFHYPVPAITTISGAGVVKSLVNFNRIVAALVLIFQLEGEESQVDILPRWRLNNPVAIFFVFIVMVAILGVRIKVFNTSRRLKVPTANYLGKFNHVSVVATIRVLKYQLREWLESRDAERKNQI